MLQFIRLLWRKKERPIKIYPEKLRSGDIMVMLAIAVATILIAILFFYEIQNLGPEEVTFEQSDSKSSNIRIGLDFKKASYSNTYGDIVKGVVVIDQMPGFLINSDGLLKKDVIIYINSLINSRIVLSKGSKFSMKQEFISVASKLGGFFFPDYNGVVNVSAYAISKNGTVSQNIPIRIESEVHTQSNKLVLNSAKQPIHNNINNAYNRGVIFPVNSGFANTSSSATTYTFNLSYAPHIPFLVILSFIAIALFNLSNLSCLVNLIRNQDWHLNSVMLAIIIMSLPFSLMLLNIMPKSHEISVICYFITKITFIFFSLNLLTLVLRFKFSSLAKS